MADEIERPSFTTWCLACLGTEAGAFIWFLGVQKVNRPPLWQLLVAMFMVALLYVGVYQWRCWKWRRNDPKETEKRKFAKNKWIMLEGTAQRDGLTGEEALRADSQDPTRSEERRQRSQATLDALLKAKKDMR
jgi:hypothetical protein